MADYCGLKVKKKTLKNVENELIIFGVAKMKLGKSKETGLLVAVSKAGICCVELGVRKKELIDELKKRFPEADLLQDDKLCAKILKKVGDYLKRPEKTAEGALPLDLRGTEFQLTVWREMLQIPRGKMVSYSELAKNIGKPGSYRAVAGACAANKIALIVPCHRVLRSDGSLGGYRWGDDLKKRLLKKEGALG